MFILFVVRTGKILIRSLDGSARFSKYSNPDFPLALASRRICFVLKLKLCIPVRAVRELVTECLKIYRKTVLHLLKQT